MPVRVRMFRYQSRCSSLRRNYIDARFGFLGHAAADRQPLAIRREPVAAIAASGASNVDWLRESTCRRNLHDLALLIEEQTAPVPCPVRRFKAAPCRINHQST